MLPSRLICLSVLLITFAGCKAQKEIVSNNDERSYRFFNQLIGIIELDTYGEIFSQIYGEYPDRDEFRLNAQWCYNYINERLSGDELPFEGGPFSDRKEGSPGYPTYTWLSHYIEYRVIGHEHFGRSFNYKGWPTSYFSFMAAFHEWLNGNLDGDMKIIRDGSEIPIRAQQVDTAGPANAGP